MGPLTGLSKLSRLSLLYLISATIPATQAIDLFSRQGATCGGMSQLSQCPGNFPSDFCCSNDTTCTPINGTQVASVICCPTGRDCSFILPIACDITQLNATLHPDNQIHLSDTKDIKLPTCGEKCCPLGYTCNGGMCSINSATSSPTSSTAPTPSATDPASASQTEACAAPPVVQTQEGFDGRSFAAGFFPGIVLGGLGVLGLIWVIKKRRESQERSRYSGDFGHVARTISDPIYDPVYATRTDFIRRGSGSAQHSPNSTTGMVQKGSGGAGGMTPKLKGFWERTPKLSFGGFSPGPGLPANPAPPPPAVRAGYADPYTTPNRTPNRTTSTRSRKAGRPLTTRSTSTETIDVLMPAPSFLAPPKAPGMRDNRFTQDSGHTTFTKLMERAGYEEDSRDHIRNYKGSPTKPR